MSWIIILYNLNISFDKEYLIMENYKNDLINVLTKIDRRKVQIALLIFILSMFVLSAGAPGAFGDHANMKILAGF